MTWLVIGSRGQLGNDLLRVLGERAVGVDVPDIDITDLDSVRETLDRVGPEVVVNCAAYTAVDAAETDETRAEAVNGRGPANLARACRTRLLHISTDYVFNGTAASPYPEDAAPAPRSAYGRTKLHGERAVLNHPDAYVVRTAWLYGATGRNFVKTLLELERTRETVSVVTDQVGQPTWSRDLAGQLVRLGESSAEPGVYHGTNAGQTSWFGFARRIFSLLGADPARVQPTTTDQFPRPAARPAYSVLGHERWRRQGLPEMRPWEQALAEALSSIRAATP
ncbi:MAG TPA: dTDP-4-dehydrorhamnose reductase [Actinomycetota bacterium]|nr:dTDP-4-dehydrorhamnose reductase [Actinomycetota bacterium]